MKPDTAILPWTTHASLVTTIEQNTMAVQSLLNGHWFSRRGTTADIAVIPGSVRHTTPTTGSFNISYRVSFFYACDGIELGQREQSTILFTTSATNSQLILQVEPDPERQDEL